MTKPPDKSKVVRKLRCAVYTRKSSEEGLEQEFNSLHAKREACEAYIASQRSEGWVLVRDQYDDGGISGGTLERPGLKRLLEDIEDGLVDVVVVYKIDRLSRSLADFAKLVEVFDRNGVTFVSVTQSFNTTTSMGRLTLNILLSFAQFEREVTAEREGIAPSYMTRILRLTLLAPDIVEAILDGKQGPEVTLANLMEPFPLDWKAQKTGQSV